MSGEMFAVENEGLEDADMITKKKNTRRISDDEDNDEDESGLTEQAGQDESPKAKMFEAEIIEGKREKKVIQRLEILSKPKEKVKIESSGQGAKLGDIARINHYIGKLKAPQLKPLHKILYDRPGTASLLRKNLRQFNGFPFQLQSDPYLNKHSKLSKFPKEQLRTICQTLDLMRTGRQHELAERIMSFLVFPTNSGKPVLKKKKSISQETKRKKSREKSSKTKSRQKMVESRKSKLIVTDSSSEEEEEEESNDKQASMEIKKSVTASQKQKSSKGETSDEEEETSDEGCEEPKETKKKPTAKRKAPEKSVPKTKKADSSSNRNNKSSQRQAESDSSDDDVPLIKMIKKPPTNDQLKDTIQNLLTDVNLEEVTMKQLCKQVYEKYPHFDLSSRKEFIRETVKEIIS